jgi:hypothetical protein
VERTALLLFYLIKMIMITTNTINTATPPIPPAIGPILVVFGSGGGSFTAIKIKYISMAIVSVVYYNLSML